MQLQPFDLCPRRRPLRPLLSSWCLHTRRPRVCRLTPQAQQLPFPPRTPQYFPLQFLGGGCWWFPGRVSCSPGWSWTHYVAKDGLECLISRFYLPSAKCWEYRCVPSHWAYWLQCLLVGCLSIYVLLCSCRCTTWPSQRMGQWSKRQRGMIWICFVFNSPPLFV